MSLTRLLIKPSPLYDFFARNFPRTAEFVEDLNDQLAASPPRRSLSPSSELRTIGAALVYRAYLYFKPPSPTEMVDAHRGMDILTDHLLRRGDWEAARRLWEAWSRAMEILAQTSPGALMPEDTEWQVCCACLFLARCVQLYEASSEPEKSPLYQALVEQRRIIGVLEEIGRPPWLTEVLMGKDLLQLSRAFHARWAPCFGRPVVLSPEFAGSPLVGGAKADWIVDGTLIELKSSVKKRPAEPWHLWQLLGYALLDFEDAYRIRAVGFDFARHDVACAWPLEELAARLSGTERPIQAWRQAMREICEQLPPQEAARKKVWLVFCRFRFPQEGKKGGLYVRLRIWPDGMAIITNPDGEVWFRLTADEMDRLRAAMEASGMHEMPQAGIPIPSSGRALYEIAWENHVVYVLEESVPKNLTPALEELTEVIETYPPI